MIQIIAADAPLMKKKVTYVLLGERVDKLGKDLVGHNSLSELVRVVGETAKGKSGGLLDGGHVVEKKGTEKSHNACKLMKQFQN